MLTEFPASADQQRAQFIQRQQAKSNDCDVFNSDVIWTAEFASQKWLYDLSPYVSKFRVEVRPGAARDGALRQQVLGRAGGERRGVPVLPDRQDQDAPPATWQAVYQEAAKQGGIVYQGAPVRGPDL